MTAAWLQVVSTWTGIPLERISKSEASTLTRLPEGLSRAVVGQDAAVEAVSKAVQRSRSGMKDPARPQATLLFAGPSGVGKTSLALALADQLFCAKACSRARRVSAVHVYTAVLKTCLERAVRFGRPCESTSCFLLCSALAPGVTRACAPLGTLHVSPYFTTFHYNR